jgi:hypothetical protein
VSKQRRQQRKGGQRGSRERRISIRAVRRDPPDLRKLSRAIIALAMAKAEAEAQDQSKTSDDTTSTSEVIDQEAVDGC